MSSQLKMVKKGLRTMARGLIWAIAILQKWYDFLGLVGGQELGSKPLKKRDKPLNGGRYVVLPFTRVIDYTRDPDLPF